MRKLGIEQSVEVTIRPPGDLSRGLERAHLRSNVIRLFITCWIIYSLHFATNIVREIYPAITLGDNLTFDVSEYMGLHPDIFSIQGRGAFINNNPGASILGAIPYTFARPIIEFVSERVQNIRSSSDDWRSREYDTRAENSKKFYYEARERGLDVKFGLAAAVMQVFIMAPLSALSVVLMFYILISLKLSVRASLALAILYGFATPIFYRTAFLNQNLLVAHFAFFSFALLWRPWDDPKRPHRPNYLLAGLLCGWAVVLDYSGAVVIFALSLYAFFRRTSLPKSAKYRTDLLKYAAGVAFSVCLLMAYQWNYFGHPFHPAQYYMPPATFTHLGYRGMDWPKLDLLVETAFGMKYGLFTSAPLLLLCFYVTGWRQKTSRIVDGWELIYVVAFTLLFFLFCASNQYGRMQFNTGVRHILPVVPFLFLLAAGALMSLPRILALFAGILGIYWSWCLAMYREVIFGLGIFESLINVTLGGFRLPWVTTLERMGYLEKGISVLPLFLLAATLLWGLWYVDRKPMINRRKGFHSVTKSIGESHSTVPTETESNARLATSN